MRYQKLPLPPVPYPPCRAAQPCGARESTSRARGSTSAPQVRRQLGIPSLNASDVGRGVDRLNGTGYLGTGPAHAWTSSALPPGAVGRTSWSDAAGAARRAIDASVRKRAVDFDELVPLLMDPMR